MPIVGDPSAFPLSPVFPKLPLLAPLVPRPLLSSRSPCLASDLALHQTHVSEWFPPRDHCPQPSTVVCPPHRVTLYSIIPSLPAETAPSAHFPAQETTLPFITHPFYWSFISPSALLQVILSLSWLPAAVSASLLGPPASHIYSSGKGTTLRFRINFLFEYTDYCPGSQFLPL